MNLSETYNYLVRARRDLWTTLENVADEVLSRPLLGGSRFQCIKDLVFHIADVEDGWIHGDILGEPMVQEAFPILRTTESPHAFGSFALEMLLDYWRHVEQSTLSYLARLRTTMNRRQTAFAALPILKIDRITA